MNRTGLLAGTGRCDITPAPGTPQGGWGAQTHQRGIGADMPFYATALALAHGDERVVILAVDALGFDTESTSRILNAIGNLTDLPRERIRFSCSHTHSGPNTFRMANISEGLDMAVSYLDALPHRIAGAAWQALQRLEPVRIGAATGACSINVNRRVRLPDGRCVVGQNSEGPADRTVRVIRFDTFDGRPAAVILHYSCHATTIGWQNNHFTPDFPGPARQLVEDQLGCRCLFLQGTAGDLGPREGFTGDLGVYKRLGVELGLEGARIATAIDTAPRKQRLTGVMPSGANIATYEYDPHPAEPDILRVASTTICLPLKSFPAPEEMDAEVARLRSSVDRLHKANDIEGMRRANALATQAGWRASNANRFHGQERTGWPLDAIRIGPVALLSTAGEPFSSLGRRIATGSPFTHTLVSGYSNGGFGYIPDRTAYDEGGYEIEATPFSADAGDTLVEESLQLLRKIAQDELPG